MSSEEDDLFSSDEEGEHNVVNIMLCSFAHHACSPLLQRFLHDEEQCKAALTCQFALDVSRLYTGTCCVSSWTCGRSSTAGKRLLGLRIMCPQSLLDMLSFEDEECGRECVGWWRSWRGGELGASLTQR